MHIGLLLTETIYNISNKKKFIDEVINIKQNDIKKQDEIINKKTYYFNNYEKKRIDNFNNYNKYVDIYNEYKQNYLHDLSDKNLQLLINLKRPIITDVDDIYTYNLTINKNFI